MCQPDKQDADQSTDTNPSRHLQNRIDRNAADGSYERQADCGEGTNDGRPAASCEIKTMIERESQEKQTDHFLIDQER